MRVRLLARSRIRWVELGAGWFNAAQFKADFVCHSVHLCIWTAESRGQRSRWGGGLDRYSVEEHKTSFGRCNQKIMDTEHNSRTLRDSDDAARRRPRVATRF